MGRGRGVVGAVWVGGVSVLILAILQQEGHGGGGGVVGGVWMEGEDVLC